MDAVDKSFHPACKANGCPLQATVVTHWYDQEKKKGARLPRWGVCEYHSLAPGHEWTQTTRIIQRNIKIIRLHQAMKNVTDDSVKPIAGETIADWLARIGDVITAIVLPDTVHQPQVPTDGWQALRQAISTQARSQ